MSGRTATRGWHWTHDNTPERLDGEPATWDPPSWHGTGGSSVRRKARARLVTPVTGLSRALCCCGHASGCGAHAPPRDLPSRIRGAFLSPVFLLHLAVCSLGLIAQAPSAPPAAAATKIGRTWAV